MYNYLLFLILLLHQSFVYCSEVENSTLSEGGFSTLSEDISSLERAASAIPAGTIPAAGKAGLQPPSSGEQKGVFGSSQGGQFPSSGSQGGQFPSPGYQGGQFVSPGSQGGQLPSPGYHGQFATPGSQDGQQFPMPDSQDVMAQYLLWREAELEAEELQRQWELIHPEARKQAEAAAQQMFLQSNGGPNVPPQFQPGVDSDQQSARYYQQPNTGNIYSQYQQPSGGFQQPSGGYQQPSGGYQQYYQQQTACPQRCDLAAWPKCQCINPATYTKDGRGNCNVGAFKSELTVWCYVDHTLGNPKEICPDAKESQTRSGYFVSSFACITE